MAPGRLRDRALSSPRVIRIEVAYAAPRRQVIVQLDMPEGCTVEEAIEASGLRAQFPDIERHPVAGIFSRKVELDETLKPGDRVEIYRPLIADPKEARREKASDGRKGPASRKKGIGRSGP